jgi:hypothetical protein
MMPRAAAAVMVLVAIVGWRADGFAHELPARRSVDVQAERDALVLFVTWTAPSGPMSSLLAARAAWERAGVRSRAAVEGALVAIALAPIRVRAGGRELGARPLRSELFTDPSGRRPLAIAVLVEIPLDRPRLVTIDVETSEPTRLRWRALGDLDVRSPSHPRAGRWVPGDRLLTLTWNESASL